MLYKINLMEPIKITPQLVDALNGLGKSIEKWQRASYGRLEDKEKIACICKYNGLPEETSDEAYNLYKKFTAQSRTLRGFAKESALIVSIELTLKKKGYENFEVDHKFKKSQVHICKIGTEMQRFMNSNC